MYIYVFVFTYHSTLKPPLDSTIQLPHPWMTHASTADPLSYRCLCSPPPLTPTLMSIVSAFSCHQRKLQLSPSLPRAIVMRVGLHFSYG